MLPKVVGYQGFQSYGELPYPSLKAGKSKLSPNDVWEKNHQHVKQGFQHSIRNTGANTLKKYDPLDEVITLNLNSGVEHWQTNYSQSIVDPYKINKATRPSWTLHKEPHTVNAQLMKSEYKNQLGELGTKPIDKWDHNGNLKSTKLDDDLKMGTTQSTYHVPGYTGFIPELPYENSWICWTLAKKPYKLKRTAQRQLLQQFQFMNNLYNI
ncbi:hypothetical protein PPERSA_03397 [Pseudocohnilembus persalinus]|uniref:Uncharacterized protein n=1 Tax=Pseudocohnilembus persalinus TaxID=266149 RepID=A0A0V0Q7G8_PSEPJ|nr:hypothetical protein PPERSA_03397 [Pseudocohnilembus persalinus]|eukprot:KRW98195.1 hypothetical protein PPERSA_03397 [Pseudocohnilembus persalinus]